MPVAVDLDPVPSPPILPPESPPDSHSESPPEPPESHRRFIFL